MKAVEAALGPIDILVNNAGIVVLFLAADEAGFVTGSTLSINGGQYMS